MDTKCLEYSCTPLFCVKCTPLFSTGIHEQSDNCDLQINIWEGKGCKCFKKFDDYCDITCFRVGK